MERGILLPLMIDGTRPPFGYRRIQAIKLSRFSASSKEIKQLLAALDQYKPAEKAKERKTAKKKTAAKPKRPRRLSGALDGKILVFTGALSESRNAHAKKVEAVGAKMVGAVSGNTDYLVVGKEAGDVKVKKARELGVKQISEKRWMNMLNEAYKRMLLNKKVVFTGKLDLPRRKQEARAKKLGAHSAGSISGKTDFLIVGQSPGAKKLSDAKKYSVKVIEEEVWNEIVGTL